VLARNAQGAGQYCAFKETNCLNAETPVYFAAATAGR